MKTMGERISKAVIIGVVFTAFSLFDGRIASGVFGSRLWLGIIVTFLIYTGVFFLVDLVFDAVVSKKK